MSTLISRRRRAWLALGTAVALVATPMTLVAGPASADVAYATVTSHEGFSPDANKVGYWCPDGGTKIAPGGDSYVLTDDYTKVIVKAGSGQYANTVFGESPAAGQTVWADTNGDSAFNPGGRGGDKGISHIILCDGAQTPPTTDLTVDKVWEYLGVVPDGFQLGDADAGELTVTVGGTATGQAWGEPKSPLTVGSTASVSEGEVPDPTDPEGYTCTISGEPSYTVNDGDPDGVAPSFPLIADGNTVVVTNSVECSPVEEPTTSLTVTKEWDYTDDVPDTMKGLDADNAGTLTVTVGGTATDQPWGDTEAGLPIGAPTVVSEADDFALPEAPENLTCEVISTEFAINGDEPQPSAAFDLVQREAGNSVVVVNTLDCEERPSGTLPPGTLTAIKAWNVTGVDGDPAGTPGTLTFTSDPKDWGTTYTYDAGDTVTVIEAGDGTAPTVEGYTCTLDTSATTYQVGDGVPSTTTPTVTITSGTDVTVTITNTATCEVVTPPATTLTVTKAWLYDGTPAGYPVLSSADAGTLTVTVDGAATGQAWNTTQAALKVGDRFTVTEGAAPAPPQMAGYTCKISGSPAYSVNGGAFVSPAPTVPLAPSPNTVVVQNTVTCTADEVVGGVEEGGQTPEETPTGTTDNGTVGGTEDELAATGANTGPAGLALLLILSGAALLVGRRFATR